MDIQEIRRARLRSYVEQKLGGNRAELARLTGRQPSFFSDLLATPSRKSFGEKLARALEAKLPGLARGDLDTPEPIEVIDKIEDEVHSYSTRSEAELTRIWAAYPHELKEKIVSLVETVQSSVYRVANERTSPAKDAVKLRKERINRRRRVTGERKDAG